MGFACFPIISTGYRQMAGYDLKTGGRLWHLNSGGYVQVFTSLTPLFLQFKQPTRFDSVCGEWQ